MASPNDTIATSEGVSIYDTNNTPWYINNNQQVVKNGVVDPTTSFVIEIAYVNGAIWQENVNADWWQNVNGTWTGGNSTPPLAFIPSPNNTVVNPTQNLPNQAFAITDAKGDVWTIVPSNGGQVEVNGAVDQTTDDVIELAYVNGKVWQENTNFDWWSKTTPTDTWSPDGGTPTSPLTFTASGNDTSVISYGSLTDGSGNKWSINTQQQVAVNGIADTTTAFVIQVAIVNGKIWQENVNGDWWSKSSPTDQWVGGTTTNPIVQTTVQMTAGQQLTLTTNETVIMADNGTVTSGATFPATQILDTIHLAGSGDKVNVGTPAIVFGDNGSGTVNELRTPFPGPDIIYPPMEFIGGTGNVTATGVLFGIGGSGATTMYGSGGAHLYAGTGATDFGTDALEGDIFVESFRHGLDHIDLPITAAQETSVLSSQSNSNGYVVLSLPSLAVSLRPTPEISVRTDALTASDIKLT